MNTPTNQIYRTPDGVWYQKGFDPMKCVRCIFSPRKKVNQTPCNIECGVNKILETTFCLPYRPADDLAKIFEAFDRLDDFLTVPDHEDEFRHQIESAATQAAKVRKMIEEFWGRME